MTKPTCTSTTKAGNPCKSPPLTGTTHCISHAPRETKVSAGFGGPQPGAGRPRAPRAVDVLKERIEQDIDAVLNPLWAALDATSGLVVGNGSTAEVEVIPDFRTRITAARELLDRAYGRPKQATEISGPDGGPVELVPVRLDRADQVASVVKRAVGGE